MQFLFDLNNCHKYVIQNFSLAAPFSCRSFTLKGFPKSYLENVFKQLDCFLSTENVDSEGRHARLLFIITVFVLTLTSAIGVYNWRWILLLIFLHPAPRIFSSAGDRFRDLASWWASAQPPNYLLNPHLWSLGFQLVCQGSLD